MIKRLICRIIGHKFIIYSEPVGMQYYSYDVEKAGYCQRCGYDTHENNKEVMKC